MNHEFPINLAADAIVRFCIANAIILHFSITNAEERKNGCYYRFKISATKKLPDGVG